MIKINIGNYLFGFFTQLFLLIGAFIYQKKLEKKNKVLKAENEELKNENKDLAHQCVVLMQKQEQNQGADT